MRTKEKPALAICSNCRVKYPRMAEHPINHVMLEKYDCEVCEGDTNPALWGYGSQDAIAEAMREVHEYDMEFPS